MYFLNSVVCDKNVEVPARYDFWREVWCNKKPDLILIAWAHIPIYFLHTQEGLRALTTAQDGESFNGKYDNSLLKKNLGEKKARKSNSSDVFTNCFHKIFSVRVVENKMHHIISFSVNNTTRLKKKSWFKTVFSSVSQLKNNFVDSEIRDWWKYLMNSLWNNYV